MIKYNWEEVKKICNNKSVNVITFFNIKLGIQNKNFRTYKESYITKPIPDGYSYIVNPRLLLNNINNLKDIENAFDYITLASYRLYFDYVIRGDATLHKDIAEAFGIDIEQNNLLTVKNDYIHFKYEQIKTEVKDGY